MQENVTILESERSLDHVSHEKLGAELIRQWQLPLLVQEAVQYHHDGFIVGKVYAYEQAVDIVHLSNLLVHSFSFGSSGHSQIRNPSKEIVRRLLSSEDALTHVARSVHRALKKTEGLLEGLLAEENASENAPKKTSE
jgi:HD-like signal output (HDOD) protein